MTPADESTAKSKFVVARTVADLRRHIDPWRAAGERVALVPTMGGLHAGHMALVEAAKRAAERVVVSLFVNPGQFGPAEDLAAYPRDEAADAVRLAEAEVDLLYAPTFGEVYPEGFATTVSVAHLTAPLCGAKRRGHFDGVATVVAKLLTQCRPDLALFGEKDYQQLLVVRRLASDLDLAVEILAVPTVRDADGLALSSRNAFLTPDERARAAAIPRLLAEMARRLAADEAEVDAVIVWGRTELAAAGLGEIDYLEVRDGETLAPVSGVPGPDARVFVAAHVGSARLIDNLPVGGVISPGT